jgi:very-short-patch-repair endonuclease
MVWSTQQSASSTSNVWALADGQHGVVSFEQLIGLGLTRRAIEHRIARGRLHPVMRGVYAVGRRRLDRRGRWMAAVLCCDGAIGGREPGRRAGARLAVLSHGSAAALWGFGADSRTPIHVSITGWSDLRRDGIRVHRRLHLSPSDLTTHEGIPVTRPVRTLVDLAAELGSHGIERAVNEADRLDLVSVDLLREALDAYRGQRGVARLRAVLDRGTFRLTDSELERRFLRLVDSTGLPRPLTGQRVNGFTVDFFWPELGLVVETDGLRYHRTPAQQERDRVRDQAHVAAGLTTLRFTHHQVRYEPPYVTRTLAAVAHRLRAR